MVMPFIALTDVLGHIARGFGRALAYVIIRNLTPPLCFMGVLIYFSRFGTAKISVTYGLLGAYAFATIVGLTLVGKFSWSALGMVRPKFELRGLYAYALSIALNSSISLALFWADLFQLGIFANAQTVKIYRACMQVVVAFDVIWTAFSAAAGPIFPVLIFERRFEQLRNTYLAAVHVATLLATPLFLLIVCNASDILGILGPRFTAGALPLSILAFGHLVKICFGSAAVLLIVGGRQRLEAINGVIAAVLNIVLNYLLIPRFGLLGAAVATGSSLVVLSFARLFQVRKAFPITVLYPAIFRVVIATTPIALAVTCLATFLGFGQGTGAAHLIVRLSALGLLVSLVVWFVCLSESERSMLQSVRHFSQMPRGKVCPILAAFS